MFLLEKEAIYAWDNDKVMNNRYFINNKNGLKLCRRQLVFTNGGVIYFYQGCIPFPFIGSLRRTEFSFSNPPSLLKVMSQFYSKVALKLIKIITFLMTLLENHL